MTEQRSLTLLDSNILDWSTVDRITQSIVFFADSVAIRASYDVAYRDRAAADDIEWRIDALREQGLVRLWAHEYEVDDGGNAFNPTAENAVRRPADLVVVRSNLVQSLAEMDAALQVMRSEAYQRGPGRQSVAEAGPAYRQGTAEVVGLRNQLTSLVISSELNQDGLLANPAMRTSMMDNFQQPSAAGTFEGRVIHDVVSRLELGSMRMLSPDQIAVCRGYSADFRKLLENALLSAARGVDPVLTPEAVARELVSQYRAIVSEYSRPKAGRDMGSEVLWDVVGAGVPASVFIKYGIKALKWRRESEQIKPYLLLMHLERAIRTAERDAAGG